MAVKVIITGADSHMLRSKTKNVASFSKNLARLVQDLFDTVDAAKGAGLAAPQIGVSSAVCVARLSGAFCVLVNPKVIWKSDDMLLAEEGCLSLPDIWLHIPRARQVVVRFQDEKGREQERMLADWDARVAQHEIDHLNGKLIVDYKSETAKEPAEAL